jgi:tetratricopeptide (TPR) repeat protein
MRCLAKTPAARYSDFQSLAEDLMRFQRQYQMETRRLLDVVSPTYKAALMALTSARESARTLGLSTPVSLPVIEKLHVEFPIIRERGFDVIKLVRVTRARVLSLQEGLGRELPDLEQQRRTLERLVASLAAGEQALAEGRHAAAMRMFEQIVATSPESSAAESRLAECRATLDLQKADAQRVKLLIREAQARARSEEWEQVIRACDEILSIDRTVPLAIALREAGRSALERQHQRAAELRLEQGIERLIRSARAAFNRNRRDEALESLRAFLVEEPKAVQVQRELDRLNAIVARRAEEAVTRAEELQRRTEAVHTLMQSESFDAAVVEARRALECDPADDSVVKLLCDAIEREGTARIAAEQQRMAAHRDGAARLALDAARLAIRDGELLRAVAAAENAVRLSPSLAEAGELLEIARVTLASDGSDDQFEEFAAE